jgi:hypothetical protein
MNVSRQVCWWKYLTKTCCRLTNRIEFYLRTCVIASSEESESPFHDDDEITIWYLTWRFVCQSLFESSSQPFHLEKLVLSRTFGSLLSVQWIVMRDWSALEFAPQAVLQKYSHQLINEGEPSKLHQTASDNRTTWKNWKILQAVSKHFKSTVFDLGVHKLNPTDIC